MTLPSLGLDAIFKDGEAQIQNFRIGFDPDNYCTTSTGSAKLTDPFPFQANGGVNFKDVAVLNEFLKNLGIEPGVSGGINVNFTGSGDVHSPTAKLQVSGHQLQYRGIVVQDLDIRATAEKAKAEIQTFRVTLDANNRVELTRNRSARRSLSLRGRRHASRSLTLRCSMDSSRTSANPPD